jgi:hypothetical protein
MPCYPLIDKKGIAHGWMCGENLELEMCPTCGSGLVKFLCDFPVGEYATCDEKLCLKCAFEIKPDIHLCPNHTILFKDNSDSFYLHQEIKKRHKINTKDHLEIEPMIDDLIGVEFY